MVACPVLERTHHRQRIERLLDQFPVVAIVGPRQVGKTTLARQIAAGSKAGVHRFDLEDPRDLARLADPMLALEHLRGLVVLDEVQRVPELFAALRVLADRPERPAQFLVLGSASPELLQQTSETLAGRIAFHELSGFDLEEIGIEAWVTRWLRGGFPRSFLAGSEEDSAEWRRQFVSTFVQRDLPALGLPLSPVAGQRFWAMLAHCHGQTWNGAELGRALGVTGKTVRSYLDTLAGAYAVRLLQPWHANLSKRQVRSPKVYVRDTGLLHTLLDLESREALERHPKVGASWEGFALEAVLRRLRARSDQVFFWATHSGAELDLLVDSGTRRLGFEFKRTSSPRRTKSMAIALDDLGLERLDIIYPGEATFPVGDGIRAVGITRLLEDLDPLK